MTSLQIEFNAEFLPGEKLTLEIKGGRGEGLLRGEHADGAPGFLAEYKYGELRANSLSNEGW
jgi:hypothetical protein